MSWVRTVSASWLARMRIVLFVRKQPCVSDVTTASIWLKRECVYVTTASTWPMRAHAHVRIVLLEILKLEQNFKVQRKADKRINLYIQMLAWFIIIPQESHMPDYCISAACVMNKHPNTHADGAKPRPLGKFLQDCLQQCINDDNCLAVDWRWVNP